MIKYVDAIRFDGVVRNGRTEPLRINVVADDGKFYDAIVKVSKGNALTLDSLVNEMLGSLIAGDLGLPICEPFFVKLSSEFIDSIPDNEIKQRLIESNSIAFGSAYAGAQWRRWERSDSLKLEQANLALQVFAFDGYLENFDRRPKNSNLLVKGDDWRLIDHELAFSFLRMLISVANPWSIEGLEPMRKFGTDSEHIFCAQLEKISELDFVSVRSKWSDLTDDRLEEYRLTLPDEWSICEHSMLKRIHRIKEIRGKIDECEKELKRVIRHA